MMRKIKIFFLALTFTTLGFFLGRIPYEPSNSISKIAHTNEKNLADDNASEKKHIEKIVYLKSPALQATNEKKIITECAPSQNQNHTVITDQAEIEKINRLLANLNTNEERLKTFNEMFEANPQTPEVDSSSANTLNDFFKNEKDLESFVPQQVSCHSNLCKIEFPAIESVDANQIMETLSRQMGEQKLNASHILLAEDRNRSSTQLYVSLLPSNEQTP